MRKFLSKIKVIFVAREQKIITIVGLILVSVISFEAGVLQGERWQQAPLIIEKPSSLPEIVTIGKQGVVAGVAAEKAESTAEENRTIIETKESTGESPKTQERCMYVGSKNSDKYYPPDCHFATRIKPENIQCFSSDEDAISRGYQRSTACQ